MSSSLEVSVSAQPEPLPGTSDRRTLGRLLRRPVAVGCIVYLAAVILGAIIAPLIAPYDPIVGDFAHTLSGPTWSHLLGTDELGRDVLSRIIYGARYTLIGSSIGVGVALGIGVPVGLIAGYLGGWIDSIVSRLAEIALALPQIMILLVVLSVFGPRENIAMLTFGVIVSPSIMRVVRSATLAVKNELYVDAARVIGLHPLQLIARHVFPRIVGVVIVQATLFAAGAVLTETGLGFLGLGPPPPTPTWGGLVQTASRFIEVQPWLLVPTGLVVTITVLAFGLLGDALRDATTETWQPAATRTRSVCSAGEAVRDESDRAHEASALLSINQVVVELPNGVRLVDGVTFRIRPGDTVGLVGESGCGKTMTAMAVLGLLPGGARIVSGSCRFAGRDLAQLRPDELRRVRRHEIGFVPQNAIASLDPSFTVASQLGEVVRRQQPELSRKEIGARVRELLALVSLPDPQDVARRYPHELSGGMAQRVVIAVALAGNPRLLIADEPTTALDVTLQAEILDLLASLREQTGMAMLLITHDWGVVARMCQRATVMYAGQVVEEAEVAEVFEKPLHPYTEGLLQSNVRRGQARQPLRAIAGTVPAPGHWPAACRFHPRCRYATADCQLGPIPILEPEPGRSSRCIRTEQLQLQADAV
jgi:peptide/nickel transport system permease protein